MEKTVCAIITSHNNLSKIKELILDLGDSELYDHQAMEAKPKRITTIAKLNTQQQKAVQSRPGSVLVLAGPGSGKTRVLTHRVAYLISSSGVQPYNILAVTFTNKAAREMEQRIIELIGNNTRGITIGTFHATCARILRREAGNLPFEQNFVIFDADDQLGLIKRAINDLNLDDKRYRPHSIQNAISNAKNELYLPENFPINNYRDEVIQRIYVRYHALLLASNALDFDDLLLWTVHLFDETPSVRERYAKRFEHVLVDEFQDTNMAQYMLLKYLASYHKNIFVVGDSDQSIYRWRGADYRNVQRFENDFPNSQVILLEQNYRSTQNILDVGMAVIDQNPHRTPKNLYTERGTGSKVVLHEALDDRREAVHVVETIADLIARAQASPGDFAVMYRTNAQSRLLEEAFIHAGLPYKLVGAQRFYGRREIKDIVAFLRLVLNPNDEISLTRIINVPTRGIGTKTYRLLRAEAGKFGRNPGEHLLSLSKNPDSSGYKALSKRARGVLGSFGAMLVKWRKLKEQLSPLGLMDSILEDTNYQAYIDDGTDEGYARWENVMELRRIAFDFEGQSLDSFLERVALVSDQDTLEATSDAPTLLTLHAAKGLEFPVVFITGLNDGTLPHSRSFDDPEALMEERRLLYVGITRAQDRLYLLYTENRMEFGYSRSVDPSRFIWDIPDELVDSVFSHQPNKRIISQTTYRPERWEISKDKDVVSEIKSKPEYHAGMRVKHPTFGSGMILNSRVHNDDEIVDIFFEDIGLKRVVASMARLEIIS